MNKLKEFSKFCLLLIIIYLGIKNYNETKEIKKEKPTETINKNNTQPNKEIEEKINVYEQFEGHFTNYSLSQDEMILTIKRYGTNGLQYENIKTTKNVLENLEYKIKTVNKFNFICKKRTKSYLEECEIY